MSKKKYKTILNLGCGKDIIPGAINVDITNREGVDIPHNLNKIPYPFKANSVDVIYITDTFFLLDDPVLLMNEFYRILKKNGKIIITNAYFRSKFAFVDPYTRSFYTVHSFDFYNQLSPTAKKYEYAKCFFEIEKIRFNENLKNSFFKNFIVMFANKFPYKYESLSHFFPLDRITHYLIKK